VRLTRRYVPGLSNVATDMMELTASDVVLLAISYMHGGKSVYRLG
jgi:hypothetical protein